MLFQKRFLVRPYKILWARNLEEFIHLILCREMDLLKTQNHS